MCGVSLSITIVLQGRGNVDFVVGDQILVTFNAHIPCADPSTTAAGVALNDRLALSHPGKKHFACPLVHISTIPKFQLFAVHKRTPPEIEKKCFLQRSSLQNLKIFVMCSNPLQISKRCQSVAICIFFFSFGRRRRKKMRLISIGLELRTNTAFSRPHPPSNPLTNPPFRIARWEMYEA